MGSSALEHSIKVRKPYTISKQRERWTEKEHNKFLESLKLYGRSWRQIQEYVGTKSAVQIRSHAQKFFTKVVRGTGEGDTSDKVEAIEIPPPRPKRKPMHSYPRKVGYLPAIPVKEKLEWPLYPKVLVSKQEDNMFLRKLTLSEQDNLSPTSVLSTVGSDTFSSSGSNFMNNSVSLASSAVGSEDPVVISMSEQENGCQLEEDESMLQQKSSHKSNMEVEDMGTDDSIVNKEASEMEATTTTSVKLFGRIVMVTDSEKPGSSEQEQDCPKQEVDQSATDKKSCKQGSWPTRVIPMFYFLPTFGESEAPAMANPQLSVSEQEQNSSMEHSNYCCSVPTMKLRPSETSAFRSLKAPSNKPTKCSVPYRSCATVKEVENGKMENANADDQGVDLCL